MRPIKHQVPIWAVDPEFSTLPPANDRQFPSSFDLNI
jgi:hypothetical protein